MLVNIDDVVKIIDDEFSKAVFSDPHNKAIIHSTIIIKINMLNAVVKNHFTLQLSAFLMYRNPATRIMRKSIIGRHYCYRINMGATDNEIAEASQGGFINGMFGLYYANTE